MKRVYNPQSTNGDHNDKGDCRLLKIRGYTRELFYFWESTLVYLLLRREVAPYNRVAVDVKIQSK